MLVFKFIFSFPLFLSIKISAGSRHQTPDTMEDRLPPRQSYGGPGGRGGGGAYSMPRRGGRGRGGDRRGGDERRRNTDEEETLLDNGDRGE